MYILSLIVEVNSDNLTQLLAPSGIEVREEDLEEMLMQTSQSQTTSNTNSKNSFSDIIGKASSSSVTSVATITGDDDDECSMPSLSRYTSRSRRGVTSPSAAAAATSSIKIVVSDLQTSDRGNSKEKHDKTREVKEKNTDKKVGSSTSRLKKILDSSSDEQEDENDESAEEREIPSHAMHVKVGSQFKREEGTMRKIESVVKDSDDICDFLS